MQGQDQNLYKENYYNNHLTFDQNSDHHGSIYNNSGGARSQRDDDFNIMEDKYEQKMEQHINVDNVLLVEQNPPHSQQQVTYGPQNKPSSNNPQVERQPEISVYDIEHNLSSGTISILTYGKTLDTIVQFVNAFSLDQLKKFVKLVLDVPRFDVTFTHAERKKKQRQQKRKEQKRRKRIGDIMYQQQKDEDNLLEFSDNDDNGENNDNNNNNISSDLSAQSLIQNDNNTNDSIIYMLPPNGVQMLLDIISFLCNMVDKCTQIDNPHLQEIIRQLLQMNSRFYSLPLTPEIVITEFNQFIQNTVSSIKYDKTHQAFNQAYIGMFEHTEEITNLREVVYFLLAKRCLRNCFRKETIENRLSTKMKVHCIRVLNELQEAGGKLFAKYKFTVELQKYIIPKAELNKLSKTQLEDYSMIIFSHCHKSQQKLAQYVNDIIQQLISQQSSIDKKCVGFKMIDKLILNTKLYPQTINGTVMFLEDNNILRRFMNDHTHGQLLRRMPPIVKFLYEEGRVEINYIKVLVESVMRSHEEYHKVVLSLVQYLSVEHLEEVFSFVTESFGQQKNRVQSVDNNGDMKRHYHGTIGNNQLANPHVAGVIASMVGNVNLGLILKRKKKQLLDNKQQLMKQSGQKQQGLKSNNIANDSYIINDDQNNQAIQHPFIYHLFHFLLNLIEQPSLQLLYTPTLCKHLSLHLALLLPLLQHHLTTSLTQPKHYTPQVLSLLEYILKVDIDTVCSEFYHQKRMKLMQQKQQTIKYQFINNIVVNCNLYDSLMYILCKHRRDKITTEKCLNILLLITKSYKPLEKSLIQLLWKILGLHSINQFEKEQFFQFIKQLIKNQINLTEQSVKHVYFEIILRLHYDWFTPKIYDCFEMLFMRLNQDGKLLTYENSSGSGGNSNNNNQPASGAAVFHLNQTQLVGLQKLYYLYFWSQSKVSKKVKDFLYKLYNNYKSTTETKQKLSYQIIHTVMSYLLRNQYNEDHILHAKQETDYEQHLMRGFQLLLKFMDARIGGNGDDNGTNNEDAMITLIIHNATRQAAPPIKRSIQVNKHMLLKQFKQFIRKQLNPPINDIQLISKGKPLKVQRMSLKQLKIQNKNTILVENMDEVIPQRKQSEERKLGELKQTLVMVFGEQHELGLLEFVAEKYLGQQMEKICEWIMDQDKIKEIENDYKQKKLAKIQQEKEQLMITNHNTSNTNNKRKSNNNNDYYPNEQPLSFSEILGREINLLLGIVLDVNDNKDDKIKCNKRQQLVDKQWQVIKKIPLGSVQLARKMTVQLDEEWIDFENIFTYCSNSDENINNVNTQAYTWHVLGKLIARKSDQYKNKLRSDKGLELWIVGELQRIINQDVYSYELYHQIIDCHENIVQDLGRKKDNAGSNNIKQEQQQPHREQPIFSLVKSQPNFNPTSLITKIHQSIFNPTTLTSNLQQAPIINQHHKKNINNQQQQTILFSDLQKVSANMLKLMINKHPDARIVEKLLSFLLYDVMQQHQHQQQQNGILSITNIFLQLEKGQLNNLLMSYKQPMLMFYLALYMLRIDRKLSNLRIGDLEQLQQCLIKDYIEVKDIALQQEENLQLKQQPTTTTTNKQWLYYLLSNLIELLQRYTNNHSAQSKSSNNLIQNDLLYFISLIKQQYEQTPTNELIGLLAIVNKLVDLLITVGQYQLQHTMISSKQEQSSCTQLFISCNTLMFQQFIDFLTYQFIYTTPGVPILTSPLLKHLHYQLLLTMSSLSPQLLIKIVDRIITIDIIKRNRDHDNVDFRKAEQFVGIQNLGCTCYINSLVQQLYHTRLPYQLLGLNQQGVYELNRVFMQLYMSTKNVINISPMIQQVKFYGQQIIPNVQQDVEEFLISLLDYIESCNGRRIIDGIFGGSYSQELTCFSQKQEGRVVRKHKEEHFYNITLDIKGKRTLNQALVYFFRSQQLDDKIYCQQLDEKAPAVKRSFIKHFPKILIFTLKRFQFDMQNMVRNKLNDYLQFPMDLDLTEFSLEKFIGEQQQTQKRMEIEQEGNNEKINNNSNNNYQREQSSHSYQLCGILIHSGSAQAGHYYSYIQRNKQWFQFNDRIVTEINLQQIIKSECFGGGDNKSRNAYMLFYQKVQKTGNRVQKMEVEEDHYEEHKIVNQQQQCQKHQQQQHSKYQLTHHHGIFLNQIPQDNFFKQLVKDQNNQFIKQRLLYDVQYRKFVDLLTKKMKQYAQMYEKGDSKEKIRQMRILNEKVRKLQRINSFINPKTQPPIVHFASSDLMEIEQIKQEEFEMAKRYKAENRHQQAGDFLNDLIEGKEVPQQYQNQQQQLQQYQQDNNYGSGDYI